MAACCRWPPPSSALISGDNAFGTQHFPGRLRSFDAGLFCASADALEDRLRELRLAAEVDPHTVVIDCEGINFKDSHGSGKTAEIVEADTDKGMEVRLARLKANVQPVLEREAVVEAIGEDHIYGNVCEAPADAIPDEPR